MFCLLPYEEQGVDYKIFGMADINEHRRVDLAIKACQPGPGKRCNTSKQALIDYLGALSFVTITNNKRIDAQNFTDPIVNEMQIHHL